MDLFFCLLGFAILFGGQEAFDRWTKYRLQLTELQMQAPSHASAGLRGEIESLRNEIRQLRDTTMQYGISFDAALQRMEGRVEALERRAYSSEAGTAAEARLRG